MKESVIISGAYEALDREYITNKFVGQNGARNLRDGLGFLRWVDSFFDVTKDDAQINIKKDFTTKMKVSSGDASRDNMEKSWLDGLQVWKTINGNNEYDRVSLETYYTAIRDGLPDKPFEAPLVRLRQWIAEKLHEKSPIFDRPLLAGGRVRAASTMPARARGWWSTAET